MFYWLLHQAWFLVQDKAWIFNQFLCEHTNLYHLIGTHAGIVSLNGSCSGYLLLISNLTWTWIGLTWTIRKRALTQLRKVCCKYSSILVRTYFFDENLGSLWKQWLTNYWDCKKHFHFEEQLFLFDTQHLKSFFHFFPMDIFSRYCKSVCS